MQARRDSRSVLSCAATGAPYAITIRFQSLEEDLPKIAATSVLIPILQWLVNQSWNYRRRARVSSLRKDTSELNDFISKQKPLAGDPGVDQSIRIAEGERRRRIEELNNSFDPESAPRRKLARALLFDRPRNYQTILARIGAYSVFIIELKGFYDSYTQETTVTPFEQTSRFERAPLLTSANLGMEFLLLFGVFVFFYSVARRANTITGERNQRHWWRALTLLYRNQLLIASILHALYFMSVCGLGFAIVAHFKQDPNGYPSFFEMLAPTPFCIYFWILARHFERGPSVPLSPTPTLDKA
jgi:hypothetical protein